VIVTHNLMGLAPRVPRAFHAGFVGYNRRSAGGEIAWREATARGWREASELLLGLSADQMNAYAGPRFRDVEPCDLIRARTPLHIL